MCRARFARDDALHEKEVAALVDEKGGGLCKTKYNYALHGKEVAALVGDNDGLELQEVMLTTL